MLRTPARGWPLLLDLVLFLSLVAALSWWQVTTLDPAFAEIPQSAASIDLLLVWRNVAPALVLALLLLGFTRRGIFSISTSMALLYFLYFANAIKLELLDTPLLPGDLSLLGHLGGGSGGALLARYLDPGQLLWAAGGGLTMIGLCLFERGWDCLRGLPRLAVMLVALGLGSSLALNLSPISTIYSDDNGKFLAWSPTSSAKQNGLLVTLLNYLWRISDSSLPIDRAAAAKLLDEHPLPASLPAAAELPDIIILQSESFFDPARLKRIDKDGSLPELRRLSTRYRHGDLWVPAYGGGTIRTEFETLTGLAMKEFPTTEYPYFRLTNKDPVPSLAHTLAAKGYRTLAIHPNTRDFWNRAATFARMGFADFDAAEHFAGAQRIGWYPGDDALIDHMLERLGQATSPIFMFAISMENHGPYDGYPNVDPEKVAAQEVPDGIDPVAAARLRGYLHHLDNADRTLGRLVGALEKRKRRSLLLFYGDHLPALPLVYSELEFDDGEPASSQPLPWLLVDTAQTSPPTAAEATASFYLPALLLDAAGIDDRGYFKLLDGLRLNDPSGGAQAFPQADGISALMRLQQRGELSIPQ